MARPQQLNTYHRNTFLILPKSEIQHRVTLEANGEEMHHRVYTKGRGGRS